jgi:LPXTG-site transpeptidase (sortase) family protein
VNYHGTVYTYQVTLKQTVPANDTSAYNQEGKEELILYTCWPPDSIKQRYLVHADLVETLAAK